MKSQQTKIECLGDKIFQMETQKEVDKIFKSLVTEKEFYIVEKLEQLNMVVFMPPMEYVQVSDWKTIKVTSHLPGIYIEPDLFKAAFLRRQQQFQDQFDRVPPKQ